MASMQKSEILWLALRSLVFGTILGASTMALCVLAYRYDVVSFWVHLSAFPVLVAVEITALYFAYFSADA